MHPKAPCSPSNGKADARRATGGIGARRWWARAHQQLVDVLTGVFVDLLKPALDVVERVEELENESRNVVHVLLFSVLLLKQDSSKTSIIPHRFAVTGGSAAGAGHTDTLKIPSSMFL